MQSGGIAPSDPLRLACDGAHKSVTEVFRKFGYAITVKRCGYQPRDSEEDGRSEEVGGEMRYIYYGETDAARHLAVILVERGEKIRVVTAYDLDAGQKKDYFGRRLRGGITHEGETDSDSKVHG